MNYSIKKLSIKHLEEITTLIHDALINDFRQYKPETIQSYKKNLANKKYFLKLLKNKKNIVFGAYLGKIHIGAIVLIAEYGGVVRLGWLVVKKEFRQKGAGSFLLKEAETWILSNKYHYIYLHTESDQNIAFYSKRGYRYIGKQTNSWFGEDEHLLEKHFQDKPSQEVFL